MLNLILRHVRAEGHFAVACALTGIAGLLLEGGTTVHSRWGVPLHLDEDSVSNISLHTEKARIIREARLMVIDEATMGNRKLYAVLDRFLRDLMRTEAAALEHVPFGGKIILLAGDWRQLPPVVTQGGRPATVNASLKSSVLW